MPKVSRLDTETLTSRLSERPLWRHHEDALRRDFVFADFVDAFGFMTRVALIAERMDHHPNWSNAYKRLTIELTTHEVGGISARDFELAAAIDALG